MTPTRRTEVPYVIPQRPALPYREGDRVIWNRGYQVDSTPIGVVRNIFFNVLFDRWQVAVETETGRHIFETDDLGKVTS
jgi:hypothetical protein